MNDVQLVHQLAILFIYGRIKQSMFSAFMTNCLAGHEQVLPVILLFAEHRSADSTSKDMASEWSPISLCDNP